MSMKLKYYFYRDSICCVLVYIRIQSSINSKNTRKGIVMDKTDAKTAMEELSMMLIYRILQKEIRWQIQIVVTHGRVMILTF